MEIKIKSSALDLEELKKVIKKLKEIEKECGNNCTLSIELVVLN